MDQGFINAVLLSPWNLKSRGEKNNYASIMLSSRRDEETFQYEMCDCSAWSVLRPGRNNEKIQTSTWVSLKIIKTQDDALRGTVIA